MLLYNVHFVDLREVSRELLPETPAAMLLIINLCAFFLYAWDKFCAIRHRRRIPEKRLWLAAMYFGALGALLGMLLCRHKTKHKNFMLGVPALLIFQLAVLVWLSDNLLIRI